MSPHHQQQPLTRPRPEGVPHYRESPPHDPGVGRLERCEGESARTRGITRCGGQSRRSRHPPGLLERGDGAGRIPVRQQDRRLCFGC